MSDNIGLHLAKTANFVQTIAANQTKTANVNFDAVKKLFRDNPALATLLSAGVGGAGAGGLSALSNRLSGVPSKYLSEKEKENRKKRNLIAALSGAIGGGAIGGLASYGQGVDKPYELNTSKGTVTVDPSKVDSVVDYLSTSEINDPARRVLRGVGDTLAPNISLNPVDVAGGAIQTAGFGGALAALQGGRENSRISRVNRNLMQAAKDDGGKLTYDLSGKKFKGIKSVDAYIDNELRGGLSDRLLKLLGPLFSHDKRDAFRGGFMESPVYNSKTYADLISKGIGPDHMSSSGNPVRHLDLPTLGKTLGKGSGKRFLKRTGKYGLGAGLLGAGLLGVDSLMSD